MTLEYLFFQLRKIDFHSLNRGLTQSLLTQTDLKVQPVVLPPMELLAHFHRAIRNLFLRSDETHAKSHILAVMRDALLPKLNSSGLRVPVWPNLIELTNDVAQKVSP